MSIADDRSPKPVLTCSLCRKSQYDVSGFSEGPDIFVREFICDDCVSLELARSDESVQETLFVSETGSPMFEVRILNDDETPMDFVVQVLAEVFKLDHEDAMRIMLQTHHGG